MAWNNEPGGGGKDPWGGRKGEQGPPDLDQLVRRLRDRIGRLFGDRRRKIGPELDPRHLGWLALLAFVIWLVTGFYIIDQGQRGVVVRFGQYVATTSPGLHWHPPYPLGSVSVVNLKQQRYMEVGYQSSGGAERVSRDQTLMLTRDGDVIDARFAVQYQVSNPRDYLFNVRDPDGTVKEVAESAVRQVIGQSTLDAVINPDPSGITSRVKTLIQAMLDRYRAGIQIVNVSLQNAQPPAQVKKAFDDAVKAREEARRVKSDAQAYADAVVSEARAAASRMIEQANAYKTGVIDKAQGKTSRFLQLLAVYRQAPEITRKRLYLDAMESVLSRSSKVLLDVKRGNNVFYLPLGKMLPRAGSAAGKAKPTASSPPPPSLQEQKPRNRAPVRQREAH